MIKWQNRLDGPNGLILFLYLMVLYCAREVEQCKRKHYEENLDDSRTRMEIAKIEARHEVTNNLAEGDVLNFDFQKVWDDIDSGENGPRVRTSDDLELGLER
eukprot:g35660.t1